MEIGLWRSRKMETNMEIFPCDKIIYNYWGKKLKGELNHLLIYHCLDVAAVGHVFLQENDIYLSKMALATGFNKKESLSLITFYLALHDLGKFSNFFQNRSIEDHYAHCKMGFSLWSQIWEKIWQDNLFGLDKSDDKSDTLSKWKNLFEPWFESVTNHHTISQDPEQHVMQNYFKDEDITAACCFVKTSAELFLDNNSETQKKYYDGMDVSFKSKSKLLNTLTRISDHTGSEIERVLFCWDEVPGIGSADLIEFLIKEFDMNWFENGKIEKIDNDRFIRVTVKEKFLLLGLNNEKTKVNLKIDDGRSAEFIAKNENGRIEIYIKCFKYCSRIIPIKEYWDKVAIKNAKNTVEFHGNSMSKFFIEDNRSEFSNQDNNIDRITEEAFKRNIDLSNYEAELRLEIKYDSCLSNPAKIVKSDNLINKDKIYTDIVDEKFDRCLFEILRSLKKKLAKRKPHNIFFPDDSLKAMATFFPQNWEYFKKIIVINKKYEEVYGELFLEKIVTYCKLNNIEQEINSERCYPTKLQETLNLCKQNLTLEEIAKKRSLEANTIIGQIEELILCGAEIPMDKFVNADYLERIMKALSYVRYEKIESTIRKRFGDFLTNDQILLVKAYKIRNDK
jgi:CRISPR-associated endonuclease Cas3-HD